MRKSLDGHSVLIIDDNQTLLKEYQAFLEQSGLIVYTALNGPDGITIAKHHTPSVILLDLMLPDMDGLEVLHALKKEPVLRDIPVIVITALVNNMQRDKSLKAGANDYLEKTETEPAALLNKISHCIYTPAHEPSS